MEISVQIKNLPEVIARLAKVPGGCDFALKHAIIDALKKGRTEGARAATARYNIPYGWVLKAEGQPHLMGLTGLLRISGSKAALRLFPHRDIRPGGVQVQELKGHTMTLAHAFHFGVQERAGKGAPRYPIMPMFGLSAPEMMGPDGRQTEVFQKMEKSIEDTLNTRLEHYIAQILGGGISV